MVLCDLCAALGSVWKEPGDLYLAGIVEDFPDPLVGTPLGLVAEEVGLELQLRGAVDPSAAMRIGSAEVEKERLVRFFCEEFAAVVRHHAGIAGVAGQALFEIENRDRSDVILPDLRRAVAGLHVLHKDAIAGLGKPEVSGVKRLHNTIA